MNKFPQVNPAASEAKREMNLNEVQHFLESLARNLENEICAHLLDENTIEAERLNRHLVGTRKILCALEPD